MAQSALASFRQLSCPEKRWVAAHPFCAVKARRVSQEASEIAKNMRSNPLLDGQENGGQVDAFRHAYWMARLTQEIGPRRASRLGRAHEKGNYRQFKKHRKEDGAIPDEPSCNMDFLNNDAGIETGKRFSDAAPELLSDKIVEMILDGKLFVISRDSAGQFLDCKGEVIDMTKYRGMWQNPKCVVPSAVRRN